MITRKTFELTVNAADVCPSDQSVVLGVGSPTSVVREIDQGATPFYCVRETQSCIIGQNVHCVLSSPGGVITWKYLYLLYRGTTTAEAASGALTQAIQCAGKNWPVNFFQPYNIYIVDGTGAGSWAGMISNTADTLTFWNLSPATPIDNTTVFAIVINEDNGSGGAPDWDCILDYAIPFTDDGWTWEGTTDGDGDVGPLALTFTCT